MKQAANRLLIDDWIDRNGPNGVAKLSLQSEVSTSTIQCIRQGHVPKRHVRLKLSKIIGVSEQELFPEDDSSSDEAS